MLCVCEKWDRLINLPKFCTVYLFYFVFLFFVCICDRTKWRIPLWTNNWTWIENMGTRVQENTETMCEPS
jgi:hypothetical protein